MQAPKLVSYIRNLRGLATSHRSCSTKSNLSSTSNEENPSNDRAKNARASPVDREISLFGPKDLRAPLPGNVGPVPLPQTPKKSISTQTVSLISQFESDIFSGNLPEERHASVVSHVSQYMDMDHSVQVNDFLDAIHYPPAEYFKCTIEECPKLLHKDFNILFPGNELDSNDLTVIILRQKQDDFLMEIVDYFVEASEHICELLNDAGYWADFIHPLSGRPYSGPSTTDTFYEINRRYRECGFSIEDLGCCKVVEHSLWGKTGYTFVGSVFSNAPMDSEELQAILRKFQESNIDAKD